MVSNKYKIALVAVLGIGISAALAFQVPEPTDTQTTLYWFEVDESSGLITSTYIGSDPVAGCDEPEAEILCSAGLLAQDVDLSGPGDPTPEISDPEDAEARAYRDE